MRLKKKTRKFLFYISLIVLIGVLLNFSGVFSIVQKNSGGYSFDCSNNSQAKTSFFTFSVSKNCEDYTIHNDNINDKYSPAYCEANIDLSEIYGKGCTKYPYIDYAKINVKCSGDKLYVYKGEPDEDWDDVKPRVKCGSDGCSGYYKSYSSGEHEIVLETSPGKMDSYFFVCYDYDYKDGWWCWCWAGWGFWGNREVVKSECDPGDTKCEEYDYYECLNYRWNNKGKIIGRCGVECLNDKDCGSTIYSDNYCLENNVYRTKTFYTCDNCQCNIHTEKEMVQICKYGCENGVCKEEPPFNWMWILLGGSIIVFCGVLYWFLRK